MRYTEFNTITEGGKSSGVRYNSEVALLHVFTGAKEFDPTDVAGSFDLTKLANPESVVKGIERFVIPEYNDKFFEAWRQVGTKYLPYIQEKLATMPNKFGWVAGANGF